MNKTTVNSAALNFDLLNALPNLHQGHDCNIKIETPHMRLWLTRTGYEHIRQAGVEMYDGKKWVNLITVTQMKKGKKKWVDCDEDIFNEL